MRDPSTRTRRTNQLRAGAALAVLVLGAPPVRAQSVVPSSESAAVVVTPRDGAREASLELWGPAAREVYRLLERGRAPRTQERTAWGTHTTLRGAEIECEFPAFAQDVPVYRCRTRVRSTGVFTLAGADAAPEAREIALLQDAGAASAYARGALVLVGFSGRAASELRAFVRLDGRAESNPSRGAVTCGAREFPSDVPRLLASCGFAVDRAGTVRAIEGSSPVP